MRKESQRQKPKVWFVRTNDIAWMGPFASMTAAARAAYGRDGAPMRGTVVWPDPQFARRVARGR